MNIYIVYDLESNLNNFDPTFENYLFGAIKLTKNSDIDKYGYAGYGISLDSNGMLRHPNGGASVNVIIFRVDMSSSAHINKMKDLLILGRGPTQGLEHTLTAEKMYSINFTETRKKFWLSLHYNGDNSYLFVNGTEITKYKAKDSEIVPNPICLGNISEDCSVSNMKKTGLYGSVFDFSVDYRVTAFDEILDIHKYLMKKNGIV